MSSWEIIGSFVRDRVWTCRDCGCAAKATSQAEARNILLELTQTRYSSKGCRHFNTRPSKPWLKPEVKHDKDCELGDNHKFCPACTNV
jgi:hypothetical protein